MGNFYGYRLTLTFCKGGNVVKRQTDSRTGEDDFVVSFTNYNDTFVGGRIHMTGDVPPKTEEGEQQTEDYFIAVDFGKLNLFSLKYHKQLYEPSCIRATLECSSESRNAVLPALANLFTEARAKLEVVNFKETVDATTGNTSIDIDTTVEARQIADGYEVYKSSPRYDTAQKKLYLDLVIYSPDKVLDSFEYSRAYTNKRLGIDIFKNESKTLSPSLSTECKNMQILRLPFTGTDQTKNTDENGDEFLQPYLVQYNESFYSFLSRVANRCGEFLYYDDRNKKLTLGVKTGKEFSATDFDRIVYTDFNTLHNHGADSESFHNNYMVKNGSKYSGKNYVRNSELSGNEYFETVEKDKFSSSNDERAFTAMGFYHTFGTLFTHTMGAGLFLAAVNIVKENALDTSNLAKTVNKHFNEKFFSGETANKKLLFGIGDRKIASLDKGKNLNVNSVFYSLVWEKEAEAGRKQLSLKISSDISKDVMLGDIIVFAEKKYIVTGVNASFDVIVNADGSTAARQPIDVAAVPVDGAPIPPCSVIPVRKAGSQRAYVTDVDDPSFLGRVRVRFCWQKDGADSSPWIRVCTQMANSNGGAAFFKAAVGDSALIEFENGNVDMPYVTGFLPTMDQQKNKGQYLSRRNTVVLSSEHGQMMLMSDPKSGNSVLGADAMPIMMAPMSWVLPDMTGGSFSEYKPRLLGSTEFTDYYGTYSLKMSSTDKSITINSPFGTVGINAFTGISINAPNGDIKIAGKNITLTAGNNVTIESGFNAKKGSFRTYSDMILGAVADFVTDTAMPMLIDLSYLRNVIEIFIKPCEGTLSLKSGRFLMMQAGGAAAKMPRTGFVIPKGTSSNDERDKIAKLLNALNFIDGAVNTLLYNRREIDSVLAETVKTWKDTFTFKQGNEHKSVLDSNAITLDTLINKSIDKNAKPFDCKSSAIKFTDDYEEYRKTWKRAKFVGTVKVIHNHMLGKIDKLKWESDPSFGPSVSDLLSTANQMINKLRNVCLTTGFKLAQVNTVWQVQNSKGDNLTKIMSTADLGPYTDAIQREFDDIIKDPRYLLVDPKKSKRQIVAAVLDVAYGTEKISGLSSAAITKNDIYNSDDEWGKYIKNKFKGQNVGLGSQLKASLLDAGKAVLDKLNPVQQLTGKSIQGFRSWSTERRGQILMSDTEGTTMYFNNGTLKSFSNSDLYAVKTFCEKYL